MKKIKIEGMSCSHCTSSIQSALLEVEGVNSVEVSLEEKQALIQGENLSNEELVKVITDQGYEVVSIED